MSVCASLFGDLFKDKLAVTLSTRLVVYEQAASVLMAWQPAYKPTQSL